MMNASGEAVAALCKSNGIDPSEICVVVDEVALPLGTVRLRARGSAGGHNGMASVIEELGTPDFPRLRIGVQGKRYSRRRDLGDYVLEPFEKEEREDLDDAIERAVETLRLWLSRGIDSAMKFANTKPSSPEPASAPD